MLSHVHARAPAPTARPTPPGRLTPLPLCSSLIRVIFRDFSLSVYMNMLCYALYYSKLIINKLGAYIPRCQSVESERHVGALRFPPDQLGPIIQKMQRCLSVSVACPAPTASSLPLAPPSSFRFSRTYTKSKHTSVSVH